MDYPKMLADVLKLYMAVSKNAVFIHRSISCPAGL